MLQVRDCVLKTKRLELTPASVSDAAEMFVFLSDPEISKLMSWEAHKSLEQTIQFLTNLENQFLAGNSINWTIRKEGILCGLFGLIGIKRSHRSLVYDKAEFAYWCGPRFQGQGLMKEAGLAVVEFCFNTLNLNKISVGHHLSNSRSKGLILALGFHFHYHEKRAFKKNGTWIDCDFYQLFNPNYIE